MTSSSDSPDANPGDGSCATSSGQCTFRAAIQEANALNGTDTIHFDIDGRDPGIPVLTPGSAYPNITKPVIIDGTTQAEGMVKIRGINAGNCDGLHVTGGGTIIRGLIISSFQQSGIEFFGLGSNRVRRCYIGTNTSGTSAEGNNKGIFINGSPNNTIGSSTGSERNIISGNAFIGIEISGAGATGNDIIGNYVGLNASGTAAVENNIGIAISSANDNVIGGYDFRGFDLGNVISGNIYEGILIGNSRYTSIQANRIGTNAAGMSAIPNGWEGIKLLNADSNLIGGESQFEGNLISGNGTGTFNTFGVAILNSDYNEVIGNKIGPNVTGRALLHHGSRHGNWNGGLALADSARHNQIGTSSPGGGNTISGNWGSGVYIYGPGTRDNLVQGNWIGTSSFGTDSLPNGNGVNFEGALFDPDIGPRLNTVGGPLAGEGNVIKWNYGDGIFSWLSARRNSFIGNSIFSNGGLGIQLVGDAEVHHPSVSQNDQGDQDDGGNDLQNFPILTDATTNGSFTTIQGSLHSPNGRSANDFLIQFFASNDCDGTGHGEGQQYLGQTIVTTNFAGNVTFAHALAYVAANKCITATATDDLGNTSEFSPCIIANTNNDADIVITASDDRDPVGQNHTLFYDVVVKNLGPGKALGVMVTDSLPEGANTGVVQMSQGSWWMTYEESDPSDPDTIITLNFVVGAIEAGDSATIRLKARAGLPGVLRTTFHVRSNTDPVSSNNHAHVETAIGSPSTNLTASAIADKTDLHVGDTATITLQVTNLGPDYTQGMYFDSLPSTLKLASAFEESRGNTSYSSAEGRYWWLIITTGMLPLDADETVTSTFKVTALADGPITWSPIFIPSSGEADPDMSNNQPSVSFNLPSCCQGVVGNIDCSPGDEIDIEDLTILIDHMFIAFQPLCCSDEADLDDSGELDIVDLQLLINHMFVDLAPLPNCP